MSTNPLSEIDSWLYHLGDANEETVEAIGDHDADLVVIEYANYEDEEAPYSTDQLDTMRGDNDKLIVSYLSIGEAEDYRFYWDDPDFIAIRDDIIDNENPEWEGNFKVKYWMDEWQQVIFDYLDLIIDAGFNGVYLDIIDAFEYWEEEDPNSGIDYRQEMADFVAAIRAHAEARLAETDPDRTFVIIGQNGEDLIENQTYLDAIDGIGKEDLQFYYENANESDFQEQDEDALEWSLDFLLAAEAAGVEVFVVEYMSSARQGEYSDTLASHAALLEDDGIPLYIAENRDLDAIFIQPDTVSIIDTIEGSTDNDVLRGDFGRDIITALEGDDQIWAGASDAGNDLFAGGDGNDVIGGGSGDDFLIGGGADDGAILHWLSTNDDAALDGSDTLFGGNGNDTLIGGGWDDGQGTDNGRYDTGEAITSGTSSNALWAGHGNDLIIGADGIDQMGGGSGDDTLWGFGGKDNLFGAAGEDSLHGGAGNDQIFGGAGVFGDALWGELGSDTLFGGAGDDTLNGGSGADVLYGGAGDDTVSGGIGPDTLWAGAGDDLLAGGIGADLFAFSADSGNDTITDFDTTADRLDFSAVAAPFADTGALTAAATETSQNGQNGVLIDLGESGSLFIVGLTLEDLSDLNLTL